MKPKFCPKCHKPIELPKMFMNANVKAENGIKIKCGNCPNGSVKFKTENNGRRSS